MHEPTGIICGVSVSDDRATADQLTEAGADTHDELVGQLLNRPGIEEAFALQTCLRTEAYVVADSRDRGRVALESVVGEVPYLSLDHERSVSHLMRVAAGLESAVLGEDEILGQVADAYEDAVAAGAIGPMLEAVVEKAIRVGKRVRTETAVNDGPTTMAGIALRLAKSELKLSDSTALVIGAGEMGGRIAKKLAAQVESLRIANRSTDPAVELASTCGELATGHGLPELPRLVPQADLIVSATGSADTVLDGSLLRGHDAVVIDLARPRDIGPTVSSLPDVTLLDLDDVIDAIDRGRERRTNAAREAEAIVEEELDRLITRLKRDRADRVIASMYEGADAIKERELETAMERLGPELDEHQREVLESFGDAVVSAILAAPTRALRDAAETDDWETIEAAIQLFDPTGAPDREQPARERVGVAGVGQN